MWVKLRIIIKSHMNKWIQITELNQLTLGIMISLSPDSNWISQKYVLTSTNVKNLHSINGADSLRFSNVHRWNVPERYTLLVQWYCSLDPNKVNERNVFLCDSFVNTKDGLTLNYLRFATNSHMQTIYNSNFALGFGICYCFRYAHTTHTQVTWHCLARATLIYS